MIEFTSLTYKFLSQTDFKLNYLEFEILFVYWTYAFI